MFMVLVNVCVCSGMFVFMVLVNVCVYGFGGMFVFMVLVNVCVCSGMLVVGCLCL